MRDKKLYEILEPEEASLIVTALIQLMEKYKNQEEYYATEVKEIRQILQDDFNVYIQKKA